jgi:hypothetical protein
VSQCLDSNVGPRGVWLRGRCVGHGITWTRQPNEVTGSACAFRAACVWGGNKMRRCAWYGRSCTYVGPPAADPDKVGCSRHVGRAQRQGETCVEHDIANAQVGCLAGCHGARASSADALRQRLAVAARRMVARPDARGLVQALSRQAAVHRQGLPGHLNVDHRGTSVRGHCVRGHCVRGHCVGGHYREMRCTCVGAHPILARPFS